MSTRVLTTRFAGHYVYVYGQSRGVLSMLQSYLTLNTILALTSVGAVSWLLVSTERIWPAIHDVVFFLQNLS